MSAYDDAMNIAAKLAAAEIASPSPELSELHEALLDGINDHGDVLGLTEAEIVEIIGETAARGGGTNKGE